MEEEKGEVKHILIAKFKDEISEEEIQESIRRFANLINLIPLMKSFKWGKDVSIENLHQGFTHIFESTFESTQDIAEYLFHPDHVEFGHRLRPQLENVITIDYKPMKFEIRNEESDKPACS